MQKIRPYVLPIAVVLGLIFHQYCAMAAFLVPYIIFAILLLTFCAVDVRKLRFQMLDFWLLLFQVTVSIGCYLLLHALNANEIIAQGILIGVLCPVASSVAVISCMLGADRRTVTAFTIFGNLATVVVAPIYFSFIGTHQEMPFVESFWLIFKKIGMVIGLPFFIALLLQLRMPKVNDMLARYKGWSFYLWSFAFLFTIGQTIDYIFLRGKGNWDTIAWLGVMALIFCILQFGFGRLIGRRNGDAISGQQLLGQKNSAMGIWMANHYLDPLSSVFMAFYSILQNLFNSLQIWLHDRRK